MQWRSRETARGSSCGELVALGCGNGLALGALICYEAIFPAYAQERVALGADTLLNISNDAWFGRTSSPLQHLHLAALRAVEQNRPRTAPAAVGDRKHRR